MDVALLEEEPDVEGVVKGHTSEIDEIRQEVRRLRTCIGVTIALAAVGAAGLGAGYWYRQLSPWEQADAREKAEMASIPIVALFFTWFHIWLAIQMMFRPLHFVGLWQYGKTGVGLGWQGVVPRKSRKMAKTAYSCARPYLLGPREWLGRVDARALVTEMRPHVNSIISSALDTVSARHFPGMDQKIPPVVREELTLAAVEKLEDCFAELWQEFADILCDSKLGIDNDGMVVTIFTQNKELLNSFFLRLGAREFRFIERCGAALGFVCGCVQLMAYSQLDGDGRAILLPLTGFFLGIFTNWLAILVCFKPVHPTPVLIFGVHVCTVQGLFLRRQAEVSVQYSKMLCDHFFDFHKVVDYLQTLPSTWGALKRVYVAHNSRVLNETLGSAVTCFAPFALGKQRVAAVERDLQRELVQRFSEAEEMHRVAGKLIAVASDVFRTNSQQMQKMPPDKFEDLLHPVFKEDEWILILLGGVLGAVVGWAQVHFLST